MKFKVTLRIVSRVEDTVLQGDRSFQDHLDCVEEFRGKWLSPTLPCVGDKFMMPEWPDKSSYGAYTRGCIVVEVGYRITRGSNEVFVLEPFVIAEMVFVHSFVDVSDGRTVGRLNEVMVLQVLDQFLSEERAHHKSKFLPFAKKYGLKFD